MTTNYHIHTLLVNTAGAKKLFQVKLPKTTKTITGILITYVPVFTVTMPSSILIVNGKKYFSLRAGNISLKLHNPANIFYSEDVNALEIMPDYETLTGIGKTGFDDGGFSTQGTHINYHEVNIASRETIIEGYYVDSLPVSQLVPYKVKIYIRYQAEA